MNQRAKASIVGFCMGLFFVAFFGFVFALTGVGIKVPSWWRPWFMWMPVALAVSFNLPRLVSLIAARRNKNSRTDGTDKV